ncbi:ribosome biogenesis protein NOP53 [Schistocerca cancellata]|uniref:ribosome biogenesis protein NOP53 n=1 Tax=Schistocerca cancellata TaxID=274614 RepID=UPI0021196EEB|nr:ribosome biogenesis protein NOP53 [Schistocerca cancellata]
MKLMQGNVREVKKKKHISKKRKKSLRKYIDIKDVDDFLEDKRLEERLGVPFEDRPDEALFRIEETADSVVDKPETHLSKKEALRQKPVRCFEILHSYSAVQDPVRKRNRVRTPEERKHPIKKKIEEERKSKGILTAKELDAARNRIINAQRKLNRPKKGEFSVDLWNDNGSSQDNSLGTDSEWLTPTTLVHTVKNTGRFVKRAPKLLLKKPLNVPAVENPHPGISYNPSFEDHQELLKKVADDELKVIKQEKHLNRVTTQMYSFVTPEIRKKEWLSEMSEGLPAKEKETSEVTDEENNGDNEYKAINPPVRNLKKSKQKRRKMKEAQMEELKRKQAIIEKRKIADIYKLRFVQKALDTKEKKLSKLREKREKIKALKKTEPKQLSKTKYEEPNVDFNLAEELKGCLRGVKPEGNLLNDRFKSLQRRSIVEPTVKQKAVKKGKRKRYIKNSHKIDVTAA